MVGAGGTGSVFLTHLCRISSAWTKLGGEAFEIEVFDPDTVSEANLARQVFCRADIGSHKAAVLAQRMKAFFGLEVGARPRAFEKEERDRFDVPRAVPTAVYVGCVDNLAARRAIRDAKGYWLDIGNTDNAGQVILGGFGLPNFFDLHPEMKRAKDKQNLLSCSLAEALERQDLFINSTLAALAGQLLWQLMRKGGLNHHGYYVNLARGLVAPIPVK